MNYYEVIPVSSKYISPEPLTYSCDKNLKPGQLVIIKFRRFSCVGIIKLKVSKPKFKLQPIDEIFPDFVLPELQLKLLDWMRAYYPGPLGLIAQLFVPSNLTPKPAKPIGPEQKKETISLPTLTAEQKNILTEVRPKEGGSYLLHGVTGSGKTRVYLELAKKTLASGKSVIILTPEIALTPQLANTFGGSIKQNVQVIHSGLTALQRQEIFKRCIVSNEPQVIIGPRSALFAPLAGLGLVVLDEIHDSSYKQDKAPFYLAGRVGGALAQLAKCPLVMGSATPPVADYFLAEQGKLKLLEMKKPAISSAGNNVTSTTTVDMTEKSNLSNHPLISKQLIESINKVLSAKEQVLIFHNKRGDSKLIVCSHCGWQAKCSACDLPLTFHADQKSFVCHTCARNYPVLSSCPDCKSVDIIFKSPGTKSIEISLKKLFPEARISRFDKDNAKADTITSMHSQVVSGEIDILIGTQILTKGHDLPKLGLAAVLTAESGLNFPDYTSEERTYQTIHQLAGRVGRGHRPGSLVIQSFGPPTPLIQQALKGDYQAFYQQQIEERRAFGFPPFYYFLKVTVARASSSASLKSAETVAQVARQSGLNLTVVGPSPCFLFKKGNKYYWQVIIKAKKRSYLTELIPKLPSGCIPNLDPINLL